MFFSILDMTNMITGLWEENFPDLRMQKIVAILLSFMSNYLVLMTTFFSMVFYVTQCSHYIAPSILILSAQHPNAMEQLQPLAAMCLHAPVKVHVRNFKVSTKYANAVSKM
jgi:hypothetical protein